MVSSWLAVILMTLSSAGAEQCDADVATLLQTSTSHKQSSSVAIDSGCPLPDHGKWCTVKVPGAEPFQMAVYASNDIVSHSICDSGQWESNIIDTADLGVPGHAVDIGGNIGYFTFVLAHAGWNVTTFEPLDKNVQLMQATLCQNPGMKRKVNLHQVGLGAHPDECQLISHVTNMGDGVVRCGEEAKKEVPLNHAVRQSFQVKRLDDMLSPELVPKVDFLKIDVEGFECQVFAGGKKVLEVYKPRRLATEVWAEMQGCEPANYFKMFLKKGYKIASDQACKHSDTEVPRVGGRKNFWICRNVEDRFTLLQAGSNPISPLQKHRVLFKLDD
mmetsp:Transcript_12290/g.23127  ORF Transcript_12290/g.23127 Transcript_12290/m.23127 type:complete len:330 (+) Transcript_12290:63-1052(+)